VVVPHDQLDAEVAKWGREIVEKSPTAIAIAKRSFNAATEHIRGIGSLGMQALSLYYNTAESKEGVRPSWKSASRTSASSAPARPDARGDRRRWLTSAARQRPGRRVSPQAGEPNYR
jgi:hypothetical protein